MFWQDDTCKITGWLYYYFLLRRPGHYFTFGWLLGINFDRAYTYLLGYLLSVTVVSRKSRWTSIGPFYYLTFCDQVDSYQFLHNFFCQQMCSGQEFKYSTLKISLKHMS